MAILNNNQQMGYPNMGDISRANMIQYPYATNNFISNPYNNYMGQSNMQQNVSNQFLKCRPVSSREEARAFQIDLDGSLWVFTDIGNDKIYTKQINNDGTASFKTYSFTEDENPYTTNEYVTKNQFNKVVQDLVAAIQSSNQQTASVQSNEQQPGIHFN